MAVQHPFTSEASLGPPSSRTTVIGKPQQAIGHQGEPN
jgi:hypothetical protein